MKISLLLCGRKIIYYDTFFYLSIFEILLINIYHTVKGIQVFTLQNVMDISTIWFIMVVVEIRNKLRYKLCGVRLKVSIQCTISTSTTRDRSIMIEIINKK